MAYFPFVSGANVTVPSSPGTTKKNGRSKFNPDVFTIELTTVALDTSDRGVVVPTIDVPIRPPKIAVRSRLFSPLVYSRIAPAIPCLTTGLSTLSNAEFMVLVTVLGVST